MIRKARAVWRGSAAHAGCFTMALAFRLQAAGYAEQNCPVSRALRAKITLDARLV
jgi:organic hydroperoxide reductase OsmC/OhrA